MRYNKTYHQRADKLAKVHGYEFAVYMGHYCTKKSTWLAFVPHENDNLFRKTGLLNYILINERRAIWQSSSVFNLPFMQYDYFKRGRTLFREIESNYFQHCLDGDTEEKRYWRELYASVKLNWYCQLIPLNDMCLFLQESERLGRKIAILPIKETTFQYDGWKYYLCLVD